MNASDTEAIDRRLIVVEQALPTLDRRVTALELDREGNRGEHAEIRLAVANLRLEMQAEFAAVRLEMRTEFAAVRSEMQQMGEEIRLEFLARFSAVEARFANLEARMTAIEKDIEWIRSNFIGRAEFQAEMNKQTWKIYRFGTALCTALATAVFYIARLVH